MGKRGGSWSSTYASEGEDGRSGGQKKECEGYEESGLLNGTCGLLGG